MRKQSIIVKCDGDGCKEVGEVAEIRETPVGWYHVKQAGENMKLDPNVGFDFHSLRCLEKWAKARRSITTVNRGSAYDMVYQAVQDQQYITCQQIQVATKLVQSTVDAQLRKLVADKFITFTDTTPKKYEITEITEE